MPAKLSKPVPSRLKVPGSGTVVVFRLVLPLESAAPTWKRLVPVLTVICVVAPTCPLALRRAPVRVSPLVKAPVLKVTAPRFVPVVAPYEIMIEPERDKPLELPEREPPALPTSMLLAKAVSGTAKAITASHITFLHIN